MIDYRTAATIFDSGSNERIAHCVGLCQNHDLYISHEEEGAFKRSLKLKGPFIEDQLCVFEPDDDILGRCEPLTHALNGKKMLGTNLTAIYLTATALSKDFGIISDHRSISFSTVYDLGMQYGVHVLSANEYFKNL